MVSQKSVWRKRGLPESMEGGSDHDSLRQVCTAQRFSSMIIIGCDYHPGFQQIAFVDTETGDCEEQRLEHCEGAQKFYRDLATQGKKVRVGMEASGHARWFERLLGGLNIELWMGDATVIPSQARPQAEDGSSGCTAYSEPPAHG